MSDSPTSTPTDVHASVGSAGRHVGSHVRLWLVAALGLAADLWSKDWAVTHLSVRTPRTIIENVFSLRLSLNPGALFGLGAGMAPLFVGASVLALLFVVYLFCQSSSRQWMLHMALGCVLGGAAGNLYDRTFVSAYVVQDANGRRDVGELIHADEATGQIVVGDFVTRASPRVHYRDRVRGERQPVVRDFLSIDAVVANRHIWPWVFNIADALLVVGVIVLLLNFWTDRHAHAAADSSPQRPSEAPPVAEPRS